MTVVYSTVKDHGGYIDIESLPGKGSAITLYLPLTRENEILPASGSEVSDLLGESEHILVVDDVFEQRQLASLMLKRLNYTVATAAGGKEAVAYIQDNQVDIVLLDMIMSPDMDGLDTFVALRSCAPDVRVILVSGYSENSRVQKALALGAGRYIRKPYSIETLGVALRTTIQEAARRN
jgi:CheY-like chemotaxis protein